MQNSAGHDGSGDLIDWARVRELRDEIGGDEFDEVIALFLTETDATIDELAAAPADSYERMLHSLKGATLSLGFVALGALCQRGEELAAEGRAAEVEIAPILTCYIRSRAAFVTRLDAELGR